MPLYTVTIATVVYDSTIPNITVTGGPFAENQYDGKIEYKLSADLLWTEVDGYTSWADGTVVGSLLAELAAGTYDVRVTSGDNIVSAASSGAIIVANVANTKSIHLGIAITI